MKHNEGLSLSPSRWVGMKSQSYIKNRSSSSAAVILTTLNNEEQEIKKQKKLLSSYYADSTSPTATTSSNTKSANRLLTYADIKEETKNFIGNNQSSGVNLSTFKTIQCQSTHIKPNANTNGISNAIIKAYKAKLKAKKINLFITPVINPTKSQNKITQLLTESKSNNQLSQLMNKNFQTIDDQEKTSMSTIEVENLNIKEVNTVSISTQSNTNTNANVNTESVPNLHLSNKGTIRRYASMDAIKKVNPKAISNRKPINNIIDIEDLMPLEEKHLDIMSSLLNNKSCKRECNDWWKYYFNSSLKGGKYEEYFNDNTARIIIHTANNLELFSVMLCYYISEDANEIKRNSQLLNEIFNYLHLNYLLICKYILAHIGNNGISIGVNSVWYEQMKVYLKNNQSLLNGVYNGVEKDNEKDFAGKIKSNSTLIVEAIRKILINYKRNNEYEQLKYYFNNLTQVTNDNLNDFFVNIICKRSSSKTIDYSTNSNANRDTSKGRLSNSNQNQTNYYFELNREIKEKNIIQRPPVPFLPNKRTKPYTLVLDLDETLINAKWESSNKGIVIFRPGLNEFLLGAKEYFEMVLFTAASQDYAESILQMIESKGTIFNHKLFNYHTVQCGKSRIKDLSLLGRDLSTVLIVDNYSLCFQLQKANGILIKSFYGDNDNVLAHLLPILIKIAKDKGDVRQSLVKYKSEILAKISPTINK